MNSANRCELPPDDQAGPIVRIEVAFAISVNVTREQERRLMDLLSEITDHPSNQLIDGVHWVSGYGGKVLWREPAEPDHDMSVLSVLSVETTAREFVSTREREKVLRQRLKE